MIKSLATLGFFAASALTASAQTVILDGNFESGIPSNWLISIADQGHLDTTVYEYAPGWIAVPDPADPTDTVAASSSFFTTNIQASRWLITPALNLTSFGNYIKWQAKSHDPSYPDTYRVMLSTTDTQLSSFTDTIGYVEFEWEDYIEREVNLSGLGYANQTVYVAFILETTQGFKLYFNNIEARVDDPLSLNELAEISLVLYPNPTSNSLHIQTEASIQSSEIYALNGQMIQQHGKEQNIDVSGLNPGLYLIRIQTAQGVVTKRFEKR
jgi:hypothetical protein